MLLDAVPLGPEFRVNASIPADHPGLDYPVVAVDADGDFVVAWHADYGSAVYTRRYSASGSARGAAFRVDTGAGGDNTNPSVAMDADGDFVVAWEGTGSAGGIISARRYSAAGNPRGAPFRVDVTPEPDAGVRDPAVAVDDDGDFVVAWDVFGFSEGEEDAVDEARARAFSPAGAAAGPAVRVVSGGLTGDPSNPRWGWTPTGISSWPGVTTTWTTRTRTFSPAATTSPARPRRRRPSRACSCPTPGGTRRSRRTWAARAKATRPTATRCRPATSSTSCRGRT